MDKQLKKFNKAIKDIEKNINNLTKMISNIKAEYYKNETTPCNKKRERW